MSAAHDTHGHDGHHDAADSHGSLKDYLIGFFLSVVLTAIPFWLVMGDVFANKTATAIVIMGFAVAQVLVHMVYFLHMNGRSEGGWNLMALLFTVLLVVIVLAGSMWVMYHLHANMMPVHDMRQLP